MSIKARIERLEQQERRATVGELLAALIKSRGNPSAPRWTLGEARAVVQNRRQTELVRRMAAAHIRIKKLRPSCPLA